MAKEVIICYPGVDIFISGTPCVASTNHENIRGVVAVQTKKHNLSNKTYEFVSYEVGISFKAIEKVNCYRYTPMKVLTDRIHIEYKE